MEENIVIRNARVNNLRDVSIEIPRGKFVVVTGVSGSGKSSLVFDTLYAEGHRRYAESLSAYARQFLGRMSKPDVDDIRGIPPAVAIEQKVTTKNPRSTVATTTEIYDFLRLVFARIGRTFSPVSGKEVRKNTVSDIVDHISRQKDASVYLLSPLEWSKRKDHTELLLQLKEDGYGRLFFNGSSYRIDEVLQGGTPVPMEGGEDLQGEVFVLVDRIKTTQEGLGAENRDRLLSSAADAFRTGGGRAAVFAQVKDAESLEWFCERLEMDGMTFPEPDEYLFSFNSPLGACPKCGGLGKIIGVSEDLVIPDKTMSVYDGCIACWRGEKMSWFKDRMVLGSAQKGLDIFTPYCKLPREQKDIIWDSRSVDGDENSIVGINEFFEWVETQRYKIQFKYMLSRFSGKTICHSCHGTRLREEASYVKVDGLTISEILAMTADEAAVFFDNLKLSPTECATVAEPLKEIRSRLQCIRDVGLGYLTLDRAGNTLSGGESQRINLVTALGGNLVGSMYILDEPSIGLHPRDTQRLINVLRRLRDIGNTVIVVEHDEEIMRAADLLVDMGPGAGVNGGKVIFKGRADEADCTDVRNSLTLQFLRGEKLRYRREPREWKNLIMVEGAMEHNLKGIDVRIPLNVLTVVTGVSGSGKSSLVGDILYPALFRHINDSGDLPGTFKGLSGDLSKITRVEYVDQNPIGRSSRSNAVTYLKVYDLIRKLLSDQQAARINGYGPSAFSFNQEGGRCPECQGEGTVTIEMQFMADVTIVCEECGGKRFKDDILEVRYRGKNVDDILNMSVAEAMDFFSEGQETEAGEIAARLRPLVDVGLSYIKLGQSGSTLSGGETQRLKLAWFLSMSLKGKKGEHILFIFDEPTTGLHFADVEKLLRSFDALLTAGHSIVVVEHNLDVIRNADWIIDLGPDAGDKGGRVVYEGLPSNLPASGTITGQFV